MILLPIGHERQTVQRLPWVTFSLIALCILVYVFTVLIANGDDSAINEKVDEFFVYYSAHPYLEMPPEMSQFLTRADHEQIASMRESVDAARLNPAIVATEQQELDRMAVAIIRVINSNPLRRWGYIPNDPHAVNLVTCIFLHTGFWHLFGNMLFLFLAGCAIEDLWGRPIFLVFYLLSGIVATVTHDLKFPSSAVPIVGASGAIAGIMGAFLVRLAKTKIRFFYFIWILGFKMGTFEAPAFIMLPLWFLQQALFAGFSDQSAGVAFWAHIGGFFFGALFAFAMDYFRIEQKYVAPVIESKVSLQQNPLFLQAIDLSEKGDYAQALVMLQKVVRQEPTHLDALLEMRRLYEITGDGDGYTKTCAGMIDAVLRKKDTEMILAYYDQFRQSPLRKDLPAKTMFSLASFFEEQKEDLAAAALYEELVATNTGDVVAMKASSRLTRLYIEKLNEREKGEAAFWTAYNHAQSNEEWKAAMHLEMKRMGIHSQTSHNSVPVTTNVAKPPPEAIATKALPVAVLPKSTGVPAAQAAEIAALIQLPHPNFDGQLSDWPIVAARVEKLMLKGIVLQNTKGVSGFLSWKGIRFISVGKIRTLGSGAPGTRESLLLDLIAVASNSSPVLYRTTGKAFEFQRIFPGVEQSFFDAYENFIGIVIRSSGARCFPDTDHCVGPAFADYADIRAYERQLRITLGATTNT